MRCFHLKFPFSEFHISFNTANPFFYVAFLFGYNLGLAMMFSYVCVILFQELEPFPTLNCLEKIRVFHNELSRTYSPRDQFLKASLIGSVYRQKYSPNLNILLMFPLNCLSFYSLSRELLIYLLNCSFWGSLYTLKPCSCDFSSFFYLWFLWKHSVFFVFQPWDASW